MSTAVDRLLQQRTRLAGRREGRQSLALVLVGHLLAVGAAVYLPRLVKKPDPPKLEAIAVTVVPPKALGQESPTPPRREKTPEKKPREEAPPAPAPTPPPPEPEKKKPEPPPKPEAKPTPREAPPTPEPKKVEPTPPAPAPSAAETTPGNPLIKRQGSPFGNPLGASTQQATLGVEDPNFTYGYYLDRVVGLISGNWTRPPVGAEIKQALLYFRIERGGLIRDVKLVESSGSTEFDLAAIRAVESSSPLPPLPKSYAKEILGIHLIVK